MKFYIAHRTAGTEFYKVCRGKEPLVFDTKEEAESKLQKFVDQTKVNPEYTGYSHFYDKLFIVEE